MALKTNSKAVSEKIRKWLLDGGFGVDYFEDCNPDKKVPETVEEMAVSILAECDRVTSGDYFTRNYSAFGRFEHWAQGLPGILNTETWYLGNAVDFVGDLLEETEEEKARFSEMEAEKMATRLVYNVIVKAAEKAHKKGA